MRLLPAALALVGGALCASDTSYLVPLAPGVAFKPIMTVGDSPLLTPYSRFAGIPDGLGAHAFSDQLFVLTVNHEISETRGVPRSHGTRGAFVSRFVIAKPSLEVVEGHDLVLDGVSIFLWNAAGGAFAAGGTTTFSRFCSGDMAAPSAYFDAQSGLGTRDRLFLQGEESGQEGRAFAHVATGADAGNAYELAGMGNDSWENIVACPFPQQKTIAIGLDDSGGGQVYVYVGEKRQAGNAVEKAGLVGGQLFQRAGMRPSAFRPPSSRVEHGAAVGRAATRNVNIRVGSAHGDRRGLVGPVA